MNKKDEFKWMGLAIGWLILIGLIAPWLISAESDIAVTMGICLLIAAAYGTYRFAKSKLTNNGETNREDA